MSERERVFYQMCQGEQCHAILELPYEKYKNQKYCPACQMKVHNEQKKRRKQEIRRFIYDFEGTINR